jgi:hypothetical protein
MLNKRSSIILVAIALVTQQPTVVDNPAPNFGKPAFALGAKPSVVIDGNASGDSLNELFNVADATLTPTGSLIVINNRGESMREYDRSGRFVRIVSRKGQGPGEFGSISGLRVLDGDTLLFFDGNQQRITLLGPDRRHVRTISGVRNGVCCSMTGRFADRTSAPAPFGGASWSAGKRKYFFGDVRSLASGFRFEPDSTKGVSLPGYQGAFALTEQRPNAAPIWTTYGTPFTIAPIVRFGVDEMIIGTAERFEYQVFDGQGSLLRTVRAAAPARPLTKEMIATYRDNYPSKNAEMVRQRRGILDTLTFPKALPSYDRLFVEEDGTVWLGDLAGADTLPSRWARFDSKGKLLGTMLIPANLTTFRFSRGHAIVALKDTTLDFQRVMAYPVIR